MLLMQLVELTAKTVPFPRSPIIDSIIAISRQKEENKLDVAVLKNSQVSLRFSSAPKSSSYAKEY